jgi:hypothetical protein
MSDQEEILPTETTPEQTPIVVEVVVEEQPPVVEEVAAEVVVEEQPPVVEQELTNEEILLDFGALRSSQSLLVRRGAITTLSVTGVTDPTEQEINDVICALHKKHKSWEALIELDSSFYR